MQYTFMNYYAKYFHYQICKWNTFWTQKKRKESKLCNLSITLEGDHKFCSLVAHKIYNWHTDTSVYTPQYAAFITCWWNMKTCVIILTFVRWAKIAETCSSTIPTNRERVKIVLLLYLFPLCVLLHHHYGMMHRITGCFLYSFEKCLGIKT